MNDWMTSFSIKKEKAETVASYLVTEIEDVAL